MYNDLPFNDPRTYCGFRGTEGETKTRKSWNDYRVMPRGVKLINSTSAHHTISLVNFIPNKFSFKMGNRVCQTEKLAVAKSQPLMNSSARVTYIQNLWSFCCGSVEMNPTSIQEDVCWGFGMAASCSVGHRCSWDLALLWMWCRPASIALIRPLAWEPPYAVSVTLKNKKKKKKTKKKKKKEKKGRKWTYNVSRFVYFMWNNKY